MRMWFRGCRPAASCQPASETPRCWAWRLSVCTTPGDWWGQRSARQTERWPRGRRSWSSQDLPEGRCSVIVMNQLNSKPKGVDRGSAWLTAWHAEGWPDVLGTPVWSERWAVDDRICCVSRHHRAQAIASASYCHKNSGNAIPCWRTQYVKQTCQKIKSWKKGQGLISFCLHTFIFCLDAECLIRTFVCWGDSQDARDVVGGARLLDFFTVSHVRGGSH